ncbi:MAG: O-antigen ligase family protein [Bacteroidales bacterium]|nr:O-antigen ligase family protein [Bacteroidales bacterium]
MLKTGESHTLTHQALLYLLPAAVLVMFAFFAAKNTIIMVIPLIIFMMGFLACFIVRLNLQVHLLKTIALLLPFSIELPFYMNSMIRFPGELFIGIAAMTLIIEILWQPLKDITNSFHREFLWALPLLLAFLITIPFSEMLYVSVKFSFINILYISVFLIFLARHLRKNPGLFSRLLLLYGAGIIIVALSGFYRLWQWEFNPIVIRGIFQPFYKDHTLFGASSALLAAVFFVSGIRNQSALNRFILWGFSAVFVLMVIFSTSRAAFLSLIFMLVVLMMMYSKFRIIYIIISSLIVAAIVFAFRGSIEERLTRVETISYDEHAGFMERAESAANITTDMSNVERLNRWVSALRMFKERPFTGFGPGTYQFTYIPYQEPGLMNRLSVTNPFEPPEGSGGTTHSEYLLALSEMGILGLIGWIVLLGRWVYIAFEKSRNHPNRWLIITAIAALSTYIFHANFNNFLTTDKFAFLFWGTAAWLITNLYGTEKKPEILHAD